MKRNEDKSSRVQLEVADKTLPFEVTAEFALPDYHSEISRLLWVRPTFMPPERFIGGGKIDFSGRVLYEVLYTGPDGALYAVTPEEGYAFSFPLEGASELRDVQVFAEPTVDAVISRVTGPRKLTVRCRLHAHVHAFAERSLSATLHGENEKLCRLGDTIQAGRVLGEGREEISVQDSVKITNPVRMICARGNVFLPEVSAARDEVRCRGEVQLTLLLCREEENAVPFAMTQRIPFEQAVALEGVCPDHRACATGCVGRIEATVTQGEITLEAQVTLCAKAQASEEVVILRDAFLPGADADCRFGVQEFLEGGVCTNQNLSVSAQAALAELGLGEECEILDSVSEAEICEKAADGARFSLSGKLQCHLLCRRAGELCTQDAALPFRVILEGRRDADVDCRVVSCRTSTADGKLRADAELQFAICDLPHAQITLLQQASFTPRTAAERNAIELYYPCATQTLWEVAKKYGVSPQALADANGLEGDAPGAADSLGGKSFLLIP